jgi:hypothetical protein
MDIKNDLTYGALEYWKNGRVTMVPVLYVPGEAWALIDGSWREMNSGEICITARMLDKESYETPFAATLIDLPDAAFKA